jgi:hypothetical protein
MSDPKAALRAIAYVLIYAGGLAALVFVWPGHGGSGDALWLAAAAWSLACGLATVRFEALFVPVGVVCTAWLGWLLQADGLTTYDSGPIVLLFYPVLLVLALGVLCGPVSVGIVVARLAQPERAARSKSLLASLEERR